MTLQPKCLQITRLLQRNILFMAVDRKKPTRIFELWFARCTRSFSVDWIVNHVNQLQTHYCETYHRIVLTLTAYLWFSKRLAINHVNVYYLTENVVAMRCNECKAALDLAGCLIVDRKSNSTRKTNGCWMHYMQWEVDRNRPKINKTLMYRWW